MEILRHDPSRFASIPDYPFAENWLEIDLDDGHKGRMHYLDEGPKDAPPVLQLHGTRSSTQLLLKDF